MKLQTKIFLWFATAISVVFSIALVLLGYQMVSFNRDLTHNLNTQLIEAKATEAANWLEKRIAELRMISQTSQQMKQEQLHKFINITNDRLSEEYGNAYGTFAIGGVDGIGYVNEEQSIDISYRTYFQEAMITDQEYVISTPVFSRTDASNIVLICYPIRNYTGRTVGFINGAIALRRLTEITENIEFYGGDSFIIDQDGNRYTHISPTISSQDLEFILERMPQESITTTQSTSFSSQNGKKIAFYTPVKGTEWYLCTVVERNALYKEMQTLMQTTVVIWILLMVCVFVLSYVISRKITQPIEELSSAMEDVEQGNFDISVTQSGSDEIAQLARTFDRMVKKTKELLVQISKEQEEKYSLQHQVLQSQINPHFLYNTLDTLQWKAMEYNVDELTTLITALSSFFRISLNSGEEFISLKDEVNHVRNYMIIQQYRYQDILDYSIDFDESLSDYTVNKLIIQPLVENAIYHGIKPKLAFGEIFITVKAQRDSLYITVRDTGVGMSPEKLFQVIEGLSVKREGESFGLYNVHQRIQMIYGKEYGLNIISTEGEGTTITICLPLQ